MAYVRGATRQAEPEAKLLTIHQVRQRNAALALELQTLTAEQAELGNRTEAMRKEVTAARNRLTRQLREIDAVRIQSDQIAAAKRYVSTLPPPVHGGREGLQAATDEMLTHESKHLNLAKAPRRPKGPSCGTQRKYEKGCRCDECKAWRKRRAAQARTNQKRRAAAQTDAAIANITRERRNKK